MASAQRSGQADELVSYDHAGLPEPPPDQAEAEYLPPEPPQETENLRAASRPPVAPALADIDAERTADGSGTTLLIRYFGQAGDAGYKRLLAMLQYFHGTTPVQVYLAAASRLESLPHTCWVELSDEVLRRLAIRYGANNLALR